MQEVMNDFRQRPVDNDILSLVLENLWRLKDLDEIRRNVSRRKEDDFRAKILGILAGLEIASVKPLLAAIVQDPAAARSLVRCDATQPQKLLRRFNRIFCAENSALYPGQETGSIDAGRRVGGGFYAGNGPEQWANIYERYSKYQMPEATRAALRQMMLEMDALLRSLAMTQADYVKTAQGTLSRNQMKIHLESRKEINDIGNKLFLLQESLRKQERVPGKVIGHVDNLTNDIKETLLKILENETPRVLAVSSAKKPGQRKIVKLQPDVDIKNVFYNAEENPSNNQLEFKLLITYIKLVEIKNQNIKLIFNENYKNSIIVEINNNGEADSAVSLFSNKLEIWDQSVMIDILSEDDNIIASFPIIIEKDMNDYYIDFKDYVNNREIIGRLRYKNKAMPTDYVNNLKTYYSTPLKTFSFSFTDIQGKFGNFNEIQAIIIVEGKRQESGIFRWDNESKKYVLGNDYSQYKFQFAHSNSTITGTIIFVNITQSGNSSPIKLTHLHTATFSLKSPGKININGFSADYNILYSKDETINKNLANYNPDSDFYITNINGKVLSISNITLSNVKKVGKYILRLIVGYEMRQEEFIKVENGNSYKINKEVNFSYMPFIEKFTFYILFEEQNRQNETQILAMSDAKFIEGKQEIVLNEIKLSFEVKIPKNVYKMIPTIYKKKGQVKLSKYENYKNIRNGSNLIIILLIENQLIKFGRVNEEFTFYYDDKISKYMYLLVREYVMNEKGSVTSDQFIYRKLFQLVNGNVQAIEQNIFTINLEIKIPPASDD